MSGAPSGSLEILPLPEAQQNNHRFFDPRAPERPEQVLGVDTDAILRVGRAAIALGALPPRVNVGLYALPDAIRLVPLVAEMQSGATLTPEDIRPYRKPIKKLSMELSFADKLAATAGVVGVGIPIRRALNRKIEQEFASRATDAIDKAREAVASIENDVDYLASFDNPREQFVTELNDLALTTSAAIAEQRDWRVRNDIPSGAELEVPRGIMGFFTKVVRKVRNFLGFFRRKPEVNTEITAYDAGAGIEKTFKSLTQDPEVSNQRFPLLSKLVFNKLPRSVSLTKDRLALMAPEVLRFLFSTAQEDVDGEELIDSVNRNPHELRFVTRVKKHYGRYSLEGIRRASRTLMTAIRDVLPTEGSKVREIYAQAQDLLQYKQPEMNTETLVKMPKARKKWLKSRLRKFTEKS